MAFAVHGYGGPAGVRTRIEARLRAFGAIVQAQSVSRCDVAVDLLAPGFMIDPERLVTRCEFHAYRDGDAGDRPAEKYDAALFDAEAVFEAHGRGGQYNSIRIGNIRKLQVAIYNKRLDVLKKRKSYWWAVWGLDPEDQSNIVHRVELRFGKDLLAYGFRVKTLDDLDCHLAILSRWAFHKVKLVKAGERGRDRNVSRQKAAPEWEAAGDALEKLAQAFHQVAAPMPVNVLLKRQKIADLKAGMRGVVAGLAGALRVKADQIPAYVADLLSYWLEFERDELDEAIKVQGERMYFIDRPELGGAVYV